MLNSSITAFVIKHSLFVKIQTVLINFLNDLSFLFSVKWVWCEFITLCLEFFNSGLNIFYFMLFVLLVLFFKQIGYVHILKSISCLVKILCWDV